MTIGTELREPAHRVSPRAIAFWRLSALATLLVVLAVLVPVYALVPERPWWLTVLAVALVLPMVATVVWMPSIRYRVHRWEVTSGAVFTRSGWLTTQLRIAPLSRVQTVDSRQGAVMRLFGLASITVTTASAAGPITIDCLDAEVARRIVAELTEITSATEGDAT